MAVQFTKPQLKYDPVTGLHHCTYMVTGNTEDPTAITATGVGDSEYQAKRHAIVSYTSLYPRVFLGIDKAVLENDIVILPQPSQGLPPRQR